VNTHTKHGAVACIWLSSGCHWDFRPQGWHIKSTNTCTTQEQ